MQNAERRMQNQRGAAEKAMTNGDFILHSAFIILHYDVITSP